MVKRNAVVVTLGYGDSLVFENLQPGEIGQLSALLSKAAPCDSQYISKMSDFRQVRKTSILKVEIVPDDHVITPAEYDGLATPEPTAVTKED